MYIKPALQFDLFFCKYRKFNLDIFPHEITYWVINSSMHLTHTETVHFRMNSQKHGGCHWWWLLCRHWWNRGCRHPPVLPMTTKPLMYIKPYILRRYILEWIHRNMEVATDDAYFVVIGGTGVVDTLRCCQWRRSWRQVAMTTFSGEKDGWSQRLLGFGVCVV